MDFTILTINGQDLRNATHEQAVEAFRHASEPIIVEVARRDSAPCELRAACEKTVSKSFNGISHSASSGMKQSEVAVQTELSAEEATFAAMAAAALTTEDIRTALSFQHNVVESSETVYSSSASGLLNIIELDAEEEEEDQLCPPPGHHDVTDKDTPYPPKPFNGLPIPFDCDLAPFEILPTCSCHESIGQEYEQAVHPKLIEGSTTRCSVHAHGLYRYASDAKGEFALESLVFEQVKLCRNATTSKFGVTLCYQTNGNVEDICEVYVGEIEPNNLAPCDADIRVGDRIVQIDGELVRSRSRVIQLFAQASSTVTLLIARLAETDDSPHQGSDCNVAEEDEAHGISKPQPQNKESAHFMTFERPDQDSGLGRTTDEGARTEESSEQELEADSKPVELDKCQNELTYSESNLGLSQVSLPAASSCSSVLATVSSIDQIDEQLIHMGRLMQSLAVHCRQLVYAKMNYRDIRALQQDTGNSAVPDTLVSATAFTEEPIHSFTDVVENAPPRISPACAHPSTVRTAADTMAPVQRAPRMGTRGMELTPGVPLIHQNVNSSQTKRTPECPGLPIHNDDPTAVKRLQEVPNVKSTRTRSNVVNRDTGAREVYTGVQTITQMPSGQTSAYCTGGSVNSHAETNGVHMRLWRRTDGAGKMTDGKDCPDIANSMDEWNGAVIAPLSDLGGSLLSLTANVTGIPNHFTVTNESVVSSDPLTNSFSPLSNWSIDATSQSSQRCAPIPTAPTSGAQAFHSRSIDGSLMEGLITMPGASESGSECLNRSRPSGLSNVSSLDSLNAPDHVSGVIRRNAVQFPPRTAVANKEKSDDAYANLAGYSNISANIRSGAQVESNPQPIKPLEDKIEASHVSKRTRTREQHLYKRAQFNADTASKSTPNTTSPIGHQLTSKYPTNSSSNLIPSVAPSPCGALTKYPVVLETGTPVTAQCSSPSTKVTSSGHSGDKASRVNVNYHAAPLHPYEIYDEYFHTRWFSKLTNRYPETTARTPYSHSHPSDKIIPDKRSTNPVFSDIYETPYASVTVEDESPDDHTQLIPACQPTQYSVNSSQVTPQNRTPNTTAHHRIPEKPLPSIPDENNQQNNHNNVDSYNSLLHAFEHFQLQARHTNYQYVQGAVYPPAIYSPRLIEEDGCNPFDGSPAHPAPPISYVPQNLNMMEWVVKKRPDGTRYITRRPIRNRLLKERAKRVAEERCGMTTDDDAPGDLRNNRYWNRFERRRHFEKSRTDRKRRQSFPVPVISGTVQHLQYTNKVHTTDRMKQTDPAPRTVLSDRTAV